MLRHLLSMTVVVLLVASQSHAQWGTLTGQFVLDGPAPVAKALTITKDEAFCGKFGLKNEEVVVNKDNGGLANVVLFIYVARGKKAPKVHPDYEKTAQDEVRLDNKNCRFAPHVLTLRTTQTLVVGNLDPLGHNSKIDTVKNIPINPIIPANSELKHQFKKEERLPSLVGCSIHPWMNARLLIKDSPYMAVTDGDGKFTIANLPAGKQTFQVWHEACGYISEVQIGGKSTKWTKGRFTETIKSGKDSDLGKLAVKPSFLLK